jgi:Domain of unknown function (DUF4214)
MTNLMNREAAELYVSLLYEHLLRRRPREVEFERWVTAASRQSPEAVLTSFVQSPEYVNRTRVQASFPLGHYYSPVVDPTLVRDYVNRNYDTLPEHVAGISLNPKQMSDFWKVILPLLKGTSFREERSEEKRFYSNAAGFPYQAVEELSRGGR